MPDVTATHQALHSAPIFYIVVSGIGDDPLRIPERVASSRTATADEMGDSATSSPYISAMEATLARIEERIAHIGNDVKAVKDDVGAVKTSLNDARERLGKLEVRVDHLPGKGFIVTAATGVVALIGGLIALLGHFGLLVSAVAK